VKISNPSLLFHVSQVNIPKYISLSFQIHAFATMNTFVALSLFLGASALTVPRSSCSFELTASGGESGTIGQLSDGQNRIGGGLSPATFTIDNGGIIDAAGRGCILTRKLLSNTGSSMADPS